MKNLKSKKGAALIPVIQDPIRFPHNGKKKPVKEKTVKQMFDMLRAGHKDLKRNVEMIKHDVSLLEDYANGEIDSFSKYWPGFSEWKYKDTEKICNQAETLLDLIDKKTSSL